MDLTIVRVVNNYKFVINNAKEAQPVQV